jgi:hypothetical protein
MRQIVGIVVGGMLWMGGAACAGSPCTETADTTLALREKMVDCPALISTGVLLAPVPEFIEACEPFAEKHCTAADRNTLAEFHSCIDALPACSGAADKDPVFGDALNACREILSNITKECERSLEHVNLLGLF